MKEISARKVIGLLAGLVLVATLGCAPVKTIWTSQPVSGMVSNRCFEARLEPLKQGRPFFVSFRLEVKNHTRDDLTIDWNKTAYIHNGEERGIFVFAGIDPEDVKNRSIPPDIIPPGHTFRKIVAPQDLLARAPMRARSQPSGIEAGILPTGENAMRLVVGYRGEELVETISIKIIEEKTGP
ncbi:MAG: hypothetical protein JRJ29_12830 [Deltaproteobacteria bacterium]|nr:hypothetical protein [Deltaproteobacteria bacterium]